MDFCSKTAGIFEIVGNILNIFKYIIPLIIIAYATFDFTKAVTSKENDMIKKSSKRAIYRVIAGIAIFFLPSIITFLFGLIGVGESDCLKCMLDTKTCESISSSSSSGDSSTGELDEECTVEDEECVSLEIYYEG